jgi:hypothetical protein
MSRCICGHLRARKRKRLQFVEVSARGGPAGLAAKSARVGCAKMSTGTEKEGRTRRLARPAAATQQREVPFLAVAELLILFDAHGALLEVTHPRRFPFPARILVPAASTPTAEIRCMPGVTLVTLPLVVPVMCARACVTPITGRSVTSVTSALFVRHFSRLFL